MMTSSTKKVIHQFLTSTSVKGISKIAKSDTAFLRILWMLTLFFGTTIASYFVYWLLAGYIFHDVITVVEEVSLQYAFPDITVCNVNPIGNVEVNAGFIRDLLAEISSNQSTLELASEFLTPQLLFEYLFANESVMGHLLPFIVVCQYSLASGGHENCTDVTERVIRSDYGVCVTIKANSSKTIMAASVVVFLDVSKNFSMPAYHVGMESAFADGIVAVVHEPGSIPDLDDALSLSAGKFSSIQIQANMRTRIPSPYSNCVGNPKFQLNSTLIPPTLTYTTKTCIELCLQDIVMNECGCLAGHYISTRVMRELADFCPFSPNVTSILMMMSSLTQHPLCENSAVGARKERHCQTQCHTPCTTRWYSTSASSIDWPHSSQQIAFYKRYIRNHPYFVDMFPEYEDIIDALDDDFDSAYERLTASKTLSKRFGQLRFEAEADYVIQYRDTAKVTPGVLLGNIGGILNLWVGVSFVTAIEILELLYRLVKIWLRPPKKSREINDENNLERTSAGKSEAATSTQNSVIGSGTQGSGGIPVTNL